MEQELKYDLPLGFNQQMFNKIIINASYKNVSDITIHDGMAIVMNLAGRLYKVTRPISGAEAFTILNFLYPGANAISEIGQKRALDMRYQIKLENEWLFFRVNAIGSNSAYGEKGVHITMRTLPLSIPSIEDMQLPEGLMPAMAAGKGMVAVVGDTGQGKSTLLAAAVHEIIGNYPNRKVVTFEQPVEFNLDSLNQQQNSSLVIQSDVGKDGLHLPSFAEGIRAALRQAPTDILIGEAREKETIESTLLASESGHSAWFTVHAKSVRDTISRMSYAYPATEMSSAIYKIVNQMKVIICQRLVIAKEGFRRVPIREWLIFTKEFRRNLLEKSTWQEILNMIEREVLRLKQDFASQAVIAYQNNLIEETILKDFGVEPGEY